jgi:nucleoid-associated protein YgaU
MRRYFQYIGKMKQTDGTTRYESSRWPSIPVQESDQDVIVKQLDRLDILAFDYYNDATKWWIIARANNLPPGSFRVPAGTRLRIPFPLSDSNLSDIINNSQF